MIGPLFLTTIVGTIGTAFTGVCAGIGSFAGNVLGQFGVATGKGAVKIGKKTVQFAKDTKSNFDILLEENKIKNAKYKIGVIIFEKKDSFSNKEIESEFEDIEAYLQEIDEKIKEYEKAKGNVKELKNEIEKFNNSFEILAIEKDKAIDNVEEIKEVVANNLTTRHKNAEIYIKDVVQNSQLLDDEINTDVLLEELEGI